MSRSLVSLLSGVEEVRALRSHYPVPRGQLGTGVAAIAAKAHGRACVVLLSSHWERYLYSVNEEAIDWLNAQNCSTNLLPEALLLRHSQVRVDSLAQTSWDRRAQQLREFIASDGPLWSDGGRTGHLDHSVLMVWMKAPFPKEVRRYYRQFGIQDIFERVTRASRTRGALLLDLNELVEKRNNIAHGDPQTEALQVDVTRYLKAVAKFSQAADSVLARRMRQLVGAADLPWSGAG
jgi:hypothetical protein